MAMINLLIIDDHPLVIDGIKTMLNDVEYITITGACKTAADALIFLNTDIPDVILLDISLPDMDGIQLCAEIRKLTKTVKIIGLTSTNEAAIITSFLQRGGNGYLLKNMERSELLEAIDKVVNGKIYLSKASNEKVLERFQNLQLAVQSMPILTRREKEMIQLLADGLNGPQIAEKLFLSTFTIETHRRNLLKKMNANSTQMLLKISRDLHLI